MATITATGPGEEEDESANAASTLQVRWAQCVLLFIIPCITSATATAAAADPVAAAGTPGHTAGHTTPAGQCRWGDPGLYPN